MRCDTSPLLEAVPGIVHGFFGSAGGVSEGAFASLNCDQQRGDPAENVQENRRRVMARLGFPHIPLRVMNQVHGTIVKTVTAAPWSFDPLPVADGLVTAIPHIALGVLTADCGPVLFADTQRPIIGACHAGWRGAFAGILEETVKAMEALGSQRTDIVAALGPTIAQESYEVDGLFYQKFLEKEESSRRFFQPAGRANHFLFDLPGFIQEKGGQLSLKNSHVLGKNTYTEPFFSRRKSFQHKAQTYGCGASVIMLSCLEK